MHPHTSCLIFATPRSGSYLLCEALINTGLAGQPTEYFDPWQTKTLLKHWGISDYTECLAKILEAGTTPNGVFGGKIIWQFFEDLVDRLRDIPGYEKLAVPEIIAKAFPNPRYIWITRRDKVRQAVSYSKALQTRTWLDIEGWQPSFTQTSFPGKKKQSNADLGLQKGQLVFDFQRIHQLRRDLEQDEREMQQYFTDHGIHPFKVVYEDFVQTYEQTVLQILDFMQISVSQNFTFKERKMKKQADAQSEEWVQRYYYELEQQGETETAAPIWWFRRCSTC